MIQKVIDRAARLMLSPIAYGRRLGVKIGSGCRIYIKSWGSEPFLISIGNNVTITSGVLFLTHDGSTGLVRSSGGIRYQHYAPVTVMDNVFIGVNAILLPGVVVGSNAIVAAGAVVTKAVPAGSIVAGNPARIIGEFAEYAERVRARYVRDDELDGVIRYPDRVKLAIDLQNDRGR